MTKKRILFVRPTLGTGGADRVTLHLLQHFDRDKYEVSIALMRKEGVLVSKIPADVPVISLRKKSLYYTVLPLIFIYKSSQYDVVYCTSSGMSIPVILASILARNKRIITVVSERSSLVRRKSKGFKNKIIFRLKCWLTAKSNFVVAVSDSIKQEIENYTHTPSLRVIRSYNPIIPLDFDELCKQKVGNTMFQNAKTKIVAVGRLESVKNFEMLIEAFSEIEDKEAKLFILGTGSLLSYLQLVANDSGVGERVHFLGFVENVYSYLCSADVFVLSSYFEGMPGALIQAMACGAPCIATDCETGPRELISHGVNGLLIPVGDTIQLTYSIEEVLRNKPLAQKIGNEATKAAMPYKMNKALNSYFSFLEA